MRLADVIVLLQELRDELVLDFGDIRVVLAPCPLRHREYSLILGGQKAISDLDHIS